MKPPIAPNSIEKEAAALGVELEEDETQMEQEIAAEMEIEEEAAALGIDFEEGKFKCHSGG